PTTSTTHPRKPPQDQTIPASNGPKNPGSVPKQASRQDPPCVQHTPATTARHCDASAPPTPAQEASVPPNDNALLDSAIANHRLGPSRSNNQQKKVNRAPS